MNFIREYLIMFIVLYFINYVILLFGQKKNKKKIPLLVYLNKIYGVKITKEKYGKSIWLFALVNTFIIDTVYILIMYLLRNIILRIVFGIILIILLTIICYGLLARCFLMKEGKDDV